MRSVNTALVGLIGGLTLAVAVTAVEFIIAQRKLVESIRCVDFQCYGAVQLGGVREVGTAFLVGFGAAIWLFLRRRHPTGS